MRGSETTLTAGSVRQSCGTVEHTSNPHNQGRVDLDQCTSVPFRCAVSGHAKALFIVMVTIVINGCQNPQQLGKTVPATKLATPTDKLPERQFGLVIVKSAPEPTMSADSTRKRRSFVKRRRAAMIAAVCLAAVPFPLAAQDIGNVTEGRHLAGMWCSSCHVIVPATQATGSNGVPTFAAVAGRPSTTAASLRAFMLRPHPRISDVHATPDELHDLIAYILSLREK
jgi:mono/diheme cytochrome c family protein